MHLHGSSFALLGIGKFNRSVRLDYVKEMDKQGKLQRNYNKPPIKDTVTVPVGGYTIIRSIFSTQRSQINSIDYDYYKRFKDSSLIILELGCFIAIWIFILKLEWDF